MSWIMLLQALVFVMLGFVQVTETLDVVNTCAKCVANSMCVNGKCVCQTNYTGDPYFHCHRRNNLFCSLTNDPVLTTLAGAKIRVHVLGATKFVQVTTRRSDFDHPCDVVLFALMERLGGKLYVQSFELQIKVPNVQSPTDDVIFTLRLESNREQNGSITWKYSTGDPVTTNLLNGTTLFVSSCNIELSLHPPQFVHVNVGCCGILVGLRPYSGSGHGNTPGLFVEINSDNQPNFDNWPTTLEPLCLDSGSFNITDVKLATGIPDPVKAMTYLAQTNMIDWSYLNVLYEERDFTDTLRDCPVIRRGRLFDEAWFTFTSPPFLRCISANKSDMSRIFLFIILEMYYVCNDYLPACIVAKQSLETNCDLTRFTYFQDFVDQPCKVWTEITTSEVGG